MSGPGPQVLGSRSLPVLSYMAFTISGSPPAQSGGRQGRGSPCTSSQQLNQSSASRSTLRGAIIIHIYCPLPLSIFCRWRTKLSRGYKTIQGHTF